MLIFVSCIKLSLFIVIALGSETWTEISVRDSSIMPELTSVQILKPVTFFVFGGFFTPVMKSWMSPDFSTGEVITSLLFVKAQVKSSVGEFMPLHVTAPYINGRSWLVEAPMPSFQLGNSILILPF